MSKTRYLNGLLLISFLAVSSLFGGTTGKIAGVVTDKETGEPLIGVNIVVQEVMLGSASDENGKFYVLNVSPGLYTIKANYIGYGGVEVQEVRVTVDITTTIDIQMGVEAISGKDVIVVAERPMIERKATNSRRVMNAEDIENLPVRDVNEIVGLQTGAVKVGDNLYIRGGRKEEVAYYVDGVYQVNDYNRTTRPEAAEVSSQALEEVSFQAGGFDAEYGSATAGLINMSTRVGRRDFRVSGELTTDEFLSKKEAFLNTYSYGRNVYSLALSGPLGKHLTFYLNGERRYSYDPDGAVTSHPEATYIGEAGKEAYATYSDYVVKSVPGPLPNNSEGKYLGTGNLFYSNRNFRVKLGGNITQNNWRAYNTRRTAFTPESTPLWKSKTIAAYGRFTWALNSNTLMNLQVSTFNDGYETGNAEYWNDYLFYGLKEMPVALMDKVAAMSATEARQYLGNQYDAMKYLIDNQGDYEIVDNKLMFQPALSSNGTDVRVRQEYASFYGPNAVLGSFSKNETGYTGVNFDMKKQAGNHELKLGAEFRKYTVRYYRIGTPEVLAFKFTSNTPLTSSEYTASADPTVTKYDTYQSYIDNYWFQTYKAGYAENMGYTIDGSEYLDDDLLTNKDGPRRPIIGGLFFQDKVELNDLIMNLGLRYDYINPNNFVFYDAAKIVLDGQGAISERIYKDDKGAYSSYEATYDLDSVLIDGNGIDQLIKRKAENIISPRLGLAFPVTDKTVFHAQYGKYVQQPELNKLFVSYLRFAANLSAGNFTISGNPELESVKTTSYEIGFKQQVGVTSSIDLTVFYKQLTGYVQVRNVKDASPVIYANYVNGDFGSVKGLSFSYNLRRTGYISAFLNYTLQAAGGTGSTGDGQYKIAWQSGNYPTFVSPLDFDQRHTGSANLDFRTTQKDVIKEIGANFLFTFGSGRRYTPMVVASSVFPGTSDTPIAALNSGTMPWVYQLDAKIDKNFSLMGVKFNTFIWIQNVLNKSNARNVYEGTGQADYDGWFSTDIGKVWADNPVNNVELYNLRMNTPFNYEAPRTVLLGVRFFTE